MIKFSTYFGVDAGAGQFILQDHDNDAEHADDQSIVADPFALLEEGFPAAESVADVGLLFAARRGRSDGASCADAAADATDASDTAAAATFILIFGVTRIFGMNAHQGRGGFFVTAVIFATRSFHGRRNRQCGHRFPQLFGKQSNSKVSVKADKTTAQSHYSILEGSERQRIR